MKYLKRIVAMTLFSLLCLPSLQAAVIILISDLQLFDRIEPDKTSHFVAVNPDEIVKIKDVQWEGGNLTFHLDNTLSGK